jgi:hypothetical protein
MCDYKDGGQGIGGEEGDMSVCQGKKLGGNFVISGMQWGVEEAVN